MSITLNLVQLKRKKRKDGTIPIYISITENRKIKYKSTGISLLDKYWNDEQHVVRKSHHDHKELNKKLKAKLKKFVDLREELEANDKLNTYNLKKAAATKAPNDFIARAELYHESLNGTERYHEWKKFGVVLNNLKAFLNKRDINLHDIDSDFLEEFQEYLLTKGGYTKQGEGPKGNNKRTTRRKLTSLKAMFTQLQKSKEIKYNPFSTVKMVTSQPANKTKLASDQIEAIEKVKLDMRSDIWNVRNYFMYSYYNAGIRFGDICTLKWKNVIDGRLIYKMSKTGGQKNIKQLKEMQNILDYYWTGKESSDDYIFPILDKNYTDPFELKRAISSKNAKVNSILKDLAKKVGIETNVSFHIARHSFANFALEKGMDLYSISKALSHSSLSKTEIYLKSFDEEKLDVDMENIFK